MRSSEKENRILHRLGYHEYQQGLIHRRLKQESGWDAHLENCRNFIMRAVEMINPRNVTILGSGWLLDLPLKEILEKTEHLTLIDIIHPPEVMRQVSEMTNVNVVRADITGGLIEEVWNKAPRNFLFKKHFSAGIISIPDFHPEGDPGLVISLNILSQLHVLPVKHLRSGYNIDEPDLARFITRIQEKHLEFLSKHESVLITDTAEVFTYRNGECEETITVIATLPSGRYSENWIWDFDGKGSDYFGKRSVLKVSAILL